MASITSSPTRSSGGGSIRRISVTDPTSSSLRSSLSSISNALTSQRRTQAQLDFEIQSQTDPIGARENYLKFLESELALLPQGSPEYNRMAIQVSNQAETLQEAINQQNLAQLEYGVESGYYTPQDKISYYEEALKLTTEGTTDYYRLMNKILTEESKQASIDKGIDDYLYKNGYTDSATYHQLLKDRVDNARTETDKRIAMSDLSNFEKTQRVDASQRRITVAQQKKQAGAGQDEVANALEVWTVLQEEFAKEQDPQRKQSLQGQLISAEDSYYKTLDNSNILKIKDGINKGTMSKNDLFNYYGKVMYPRAKTAEDALQIQMQMESLGKDIYSDGLSNYKKIFSDQEKKLDKEIDTAKKKGDYALVAYLSGEKDKLYENAVATLPSDDRLVERARDWQERMYDPNNPDGFAQIKYRIENPESFKQVLDPLTKETKEFRLVQDPSGNWIPSNSENLVRVSDNLNGYRKVYEQKNLDAMFASVNKDLKDKGYNTIPLPSQVGMKNNYSVVGVQDRKLGNGEIQRMNLIARELDTKNSNLYGTFTDPTTGRVFMPEDPNGGATELAQRIKTMQELGVKRDPLTGDVKYDITPQSIAGGFGNYVEKIIGSGWANNLTNISGNYDTSKFKLERPVQTATNLVAPIYQQVFNKLPEIKIPEIKPFNIDLSGLFNNIGQSYSKAMFTPTPVNVPKVVTNTANNLWNTVSSTASNLFGGVKKFLGF